jgi:lysophospholipase L1-like esterase
MISSRPLDGAPFRRLRHPERLLVLVAAACLALATAIAAVVLAATDELGWGSPRWDYFLYLALLVTLGAGLFRWPRLAAVSLTLATVELGLGLGSLAVAQAGLASASLLPGRYSDPPRFEWHPLLQVVPIPSISRSVVHLQVSHSAERTRGRDYTREELAERTVIAAFGGSTTYDISVSDDETWPSRLEAQLGGQSFAVINRGVPGYTTAEHLMQTAFYQTAFGVPPRCALYYVGWNDLRNAHLRGLDPGYADFHLPSQIDALQVRRIGPTDSFVSPVLTLTLRWAGRAADTARPPTSPVSDGGTGPDPAFEAIFLGNVRSISALNRARGVRTIWIGQVLNEAYYRDDAIDGWIPLIRNREVPVLLERLLGLLNAEAVTLGDAYVGVPASAFEPADFLDNGHFLPSGARRFASLIAPAVLSACR